MINDEIHLTKRKQEIFKQEIILSLKKIHTQTYPKRSQFNINLNLSSIQPVQ